MEIEATFVHLNPSELTALLEALITEDGKGQLALLGRVLKNMQSRPATLDWLQHYDAPF